MNLYCKSLGAKVSTTFLVNSPLKKRRKLESRCVSQFFLGGIVTGDAPPIRDLIACEQGLLFGRVKRALARLASLAQIGELARRLGTLRSDNGDDHENVAEK